MTGAARTGAIIWFTGLPGSGKSTLARRVRSELATVRECIVLDSDQLRDALGASSYSRADRDAFYRTLAAIAVLLAKDGHLVLVAATASRRAYRELARASAPRFAEVYMRMPLPMCEGRDMKGLYDRANRGEAPTLPGVGEPYEPPVDPEVCSDGGHDYDGAVALARSMC